MRKRPLCIAAVLLLFSLWILPKDIWYEMPDIPSGNKLVITGEIIRREQKEEKNIYYLKNCQSDNSNSKFSVLAYTPKGDSYPIGCELSLYGTIYQLEKATNPGQFDAREYYQSQGILYTFQTEAFVSMQGKASVREYLTRLREYLGEQLLCIYDERDGGILKAVLLGDKSSLREADELLYQKNGISHVLAISGLHISMIGISLYKLLRKCNLTFWEAGLPSGILLFFYGIMTGFGVSTIRAVCMFLVMIFADICGRVYDMASAMALAMLIILVKNPLQAWQAAFLLSFGAVIGICFVYPVLRSVIKTEKKAVQAILFSVSISLVTFPISIHFFYEYPLYSMIINFIVIPCMPVAMGFGMVGLLAGCISKNLGILLGFPAHLVFSFYEFLGKCFLRLPGASILLGREASWQMTFYYIILLLGLLLLWYGDRKIYFAAFPIGLLVVSLRFQSPMEFTMLDVGQGDALYLKLSGKTTCLIDGGSTSIKQIGEYRILPYLKYKGVQKIDYVILSHLDEDHINGIREILDDIEIKQMLFPAIADPDEKYMEFWELAKSKGIEVGTIGKGDLLYGETWKMQCIYPERDSRQSDKNNGSSSVLLTYGEFSMLLTGDMGFQGELEVMSQKDLDQVDVWKVSHHGSKYSGSEQFLEMIRPQLSFISVGRNSYGHPSKEIIERLNAVDSQVRTTLDCGALMLTSDGETFVLKTGK